ncbi:acetate--CoA ligase family protein [Mesorhizobium sp. VK25A]|uniref:Acetate--CoA ligase family protein n=1 Tax=Mesorhizobium vachelliae TaxID=3072309 RepID=A0ABU5AF02_9HYPH|nr:MULTISPECIES: acetate--CoA ligase family protein [unclassified Mesorhizobium]MDX8535868.1 acetate--CoA ligase family protein [Mesorhizobium sp. VK25D]MDX8548622.1 acetate--CoA ligase family protein [Mesorhizobium sp. VK25A]
MAPSELVDILSPNSIAIIGASRNPAKRGHRSLRKLLDDGYAGAIYPINPKESEICGVRCLPDLGSLPGPVDLALVCTPAATVVSVIAECAAKGVRGAVVLAGGFAEAGADGSQLQDAMLAAARAGGVRIVGPNTSGMFNTHKACNLVGFSNLLKGSIGLLSQSGNMTLSLVTEAHGNGHVGLSTYLGIGNEADIRFDEYLDYFAGDPNTNVVIAYVEGLKDGRRFLNALRRISPEKPVVIYKSGRTSAGRSSAKSHSGALAGEYAVSEAVLRQAGAILAHRSDEILPMAEALSLLPSLRSRRLAILADGGGHATVAADALSERGLALAPLSEDTRRRLTAELPPAASVINPVDVAGGTDSDPSVFATCAEILLQDPMVDGLLISGLYGGYAVRFSQDLLSAEIDATNLIGAMPRRFGKPIVVHSLYGALQADKRPLPILEVHRAGIPVHSSLETAVRCMQALAECGEMGRAFAALPPQRAQRGAVFEEVLARCRTEGRRVVLEHEGRASLRDFGLDLTPALLAVNEKEAEEAFRRLGTKPVAMKIVSRDILHKTEAGGVKLDIGDVASVRSGFLEIVANVKAAVINPNIAGVLVTPMASKGGVELIVGVVRDASYGPIMMFGLGGVLVELLRDVVFRALPISRNDAFTMLDEIKAKAVLDGVRGGAPVDRDALADFMVSISDLVEAFPEIDELDLNPIHAYPDGLAVSDVRILLTASSIVRSSKQGIET